MTGTCCDIKGKPTERETGGWSSDFLPWFTIAFTAVVYAFVAVNIPLAGEEVEFSHTYEFLLATWKGTPEVMNMHYMNRNPRMAEMLNTVMLNFAPGWVLSLVWGLFSAAFFGVMLATWSNRKTNPLLRMAFLLTLAFGLRWDTLWLEYTTYANYVWGSAWGIGVTLLAVRGNITRGSNLMWLSLPLCMMGGWMQEALGAALAAGLCVYLPASGFLRKASGARIGMVMAIMAGAAVALASPSTWTRVAHNTHRLDPEPVWQLLLFSAWATAPALALATFTFAYRGDTFKKLCRSTWVIFMTGSLAAIPILIVSGFSGRPGWTSQLFGFIALFQNISAIWHPRFRPWQIPASFAIFMILALHYSEMLRWQHRLYGETREIAALAAQARKEGRRVVYYDYTPDPDVPWWVMRKTRGYPDEDDNHYQLSFWYEIFRENKYYAVLPKEAEGIDLCSFRGRKVVGRVLLADTQMPVRRDPVSVPPYTHWLADIGGVTYVETVLRACGNTIYMYSPEDPDPGEK
ncbi:MAG: hypothetical protein NC204_01670 [Candidatus Amulumruptor caecigallinarius]|nr:hypothetical protein [Candidatus Amulumruptor caecigallinarius]